MKHANKVNMQFKYVSAASTNVAKTIARARKRQDEFKAKQEAEAEAAKLRDESIEAEVQRKVRKMR